MVTKKVAGRRKSRPPRKAPSKTPRARATPVPPTKRPKRRTAKKAPLPSRNERQGGRPTTQLTRLEAAKLLGTTVKNVINLENRGHLRGSRDRLGFARYKRADVQAVAERRKAKGDLAASTAETIQTLREEMTDLRATVAEMAAQLKTLLTAKTASR